MIVPDVNLLVFAHDEAAPFHTVARTWWESALNASEPVGLPWAVALGFVRITTHRSILLRPLPVQDALDYVSSWLERENVVALESTPGHWDRISAGIRALGAAGNLTTDAHIAALAIEHGAEVHSNDQDFGRFPGLKWVNPLIRKAGRNR